MSARHKPSVLLQRDEIVAAPIQHAEIVAAPTQRACEDRTFGIPSVLYLLTALMFLGFITVLSTAFSGGMLVPYAVFAVFLAAFFVVPTLWVRMRRDENRSSALRWNELMENGIPTATGQTSGLEATVLVLLLPFLTLCWAIAIAVIAVLV